MKTASGIEYEIKQVSFADRVRCSDVPVEVQGGSYIVRNSFPRLIEWARCGLDKLDGKKITDDNFDKEMMKLSDEDITDIANSIREATTNPKKKSS